MEHSPKRIETTLGELIAAAGALAFEYSDNDREAYRMARLALIELIKNRSQSAEFDEEFDSANAAKQTVH